MNVGLIGCGGISKLHMRVYKSMKNVDVVGVCDLNMDHAKSLAQEFKIGKVFQKYEDLFEVKDLDLVDICTPVSTHARIACDAAKAVSAVIVEKPMAINTSDCQKMINESRKYGSKLCVGHNQIFLPSIQEAKSLINKGVYNLLSFRTSQKESFDLLKAQGFAADWMVTPQQRGIIWEVCCHLAYLQLHFLPDIVEVCAVGGKAKYPVYDNFAVLLRTETERFGVIELYWMQKETEIIYELCDSEGKRLQIYRDFDYLLQNLAEPPFNVGGVFRHILIDKKRILRKWAKFGTNYIFRKKLIPHFTLISNFVNSIENDLPPPVSPEEGRRTINLLECIEKSLVEKTPVSLNP